MRIGYPNLATSVAESTPCISGCYPENIFRESVSLKYSPDGETGFIILEISETANTLLLDGIEGEHCVIKILDSEKNVLQDFDYELRKTDSRIGEYTISRFLTDYNEVQGKHFVQVDLTKGSSNDIAVGIVYAAWTGIPFKEPEGAATSLDEHSIEYDLSFGHETSKKGKNRDIVSVDIEFRRDKEQYEALITKLKEVRIEPAIIILCENDKGPLSAYYARVEKNSVKFDIPTNIERNVSFSIKQII
ncbi:MAG: hypothetical protein GY754_16860 [bacterium]|nr:hypothetical protein [bacterium]